jgi:serine/threonine protein kinase
MAQATGINELVAEEAAYSPKIVKRSSSESYHSAESGDVTGASTRSPNDSRTVTPVPSDTTASTTDVTEETVGVDPRNTNLDYFHVEARFDQAISQGDFTKIKGLSNCCRDDGKIELHSWSTHSLTVVVKRVIMSRVVANISKESNERIVYRGHCQRHAEDCLNEIGVYSYLARQSDLPLYVLKMHTTFQGGSDIWLVLEHASDGDLFAVAQKLKREGTSLSTCQLMTWTWQLLQAVCYLHKHGIGHRDISMENVLLCKGNVRLMDFGQSVRTHSLDGVLLRYFNPLGKPYYRPPECYSPMHNTVEVNVPPSAHPGEIAFVRTVTGDTMCEVLLPSTAIPGKVCAAEPWGYAVAPVDMLAVGVCMFIMTTGMPPWRQANLGDQHFAWVHQCGMPQLVKAWKKSMPAGGCELMSAMVQSDPARRPSAEQCLSHSWFGPLSATAVPTHPAHQSFTSGGTSCGETSLEFPGFAALQTPTAFDPYVQDAVVRSAAAMEVSCGMSACGGVLAGDFYHMPDNCVRSAVQVPEELTLQRFSAEDLPPAAPTSPQFAFEPTTFTVPDSKPADVANQLVDFLTLAAGAVLKKVNAKKFTIKAEVDGEDGVCMLKIRMYRQDEPGSYVVEFQRRGGDSTAFHKLFDLASNQFKKASKQSMESNTSEESIPASDKVVSRRAHTPPLPKERSRLRPSGALARRHSVAGHLEKPKIATVEAIECLTLERSNAVGSGLNAVRCRSKSSTSKGLTPFRPASLKKLNSTF